MSAAGGWSVASYLFSRIFSRKQLQTLADPVSGLSADGAVSSSIGTEEASEEAGIDAPLMLAARPEMENVMASPKKRDGPSPVFEDAEAELEHSPEDVVDTRTAIRSVRAVVLTELSTRASTHELESKIGGVFRSAHVPESTSAGAAVVVATRMLAATQMTSRSLGSPKTARSKPTAPFALSSHVLAARWPSTQHH